MGPDSEAALTGFSIWLSLSLGFSTSGDILQLQCKFDVYVNNCFARERANAPNEMQNEVESKRNLGESNLASWCFVWTGAWGGVV